MSLAFSWYLQPTKLSIMLYVIFKVKTKNNEIAVKTLFSTKKKKYSCTNIISILFYFNFYKYN